MSSSARFATVPEPQPVIFDLADGLRVLLLPDDSVPATAVHLRLAGGSSLDPEGKSGLTHLCEHLLYAGLDAEGLRAHPRRIREVGGVTQAYTSHDEVVFQDLLPAGEVTTGLRIAQDRLAGTLGALSTELLDVERRVLLRERAEVLGNQTLGGVLETLHQRLYPHDHPYHRSPMGEPADLQGLQVADLSHHIETVLRSSPAVLLVAGRFEPNSVAETIKALFEDVPPRGPSKGSKSCPHGGGQVSVEGPGARVFVAWRASGNDDEENQLLLLLVEILAGEGAFRPRSAALASQAEYVSLHLVPMAAATTVVLEVVGASTMDPQVLKEAAVEEARSWAHTAFGEREIEGARLRLFRNRASQLDDLPSLAEWVGGREMRRLLSPSVRNAPRTPRESVRPSTLASFAHRYFDPQGSSFSSLPAIEAAS